MCWRRLLWRSFEQNGWSLEAQALYSDLPDDSRRLAKKMMEQEN